MKILYVVHDNKRGGAAISFLEMITEIRKRNEVFVITPHKNGFIPEQLDILNIKHINAHYYAWLVGGFHSKIGRIIKQAVYYLAVKYNFFEATRIAAKLKKERYDLVHTNSSVTNFGGVLANKLKVPHIWHIRELKESFSLIPVINERKLFNFMKENASRMIAISKYVEENIKENTHSEQIVQIYNGVSEGVINEKQEFPCKGDTIKFLIAGNICKEKGQESTILATKYLIQNNVSRFQLFIAGSGNTTVLRQLIIENNLENNVIILGEVKDMKKLRNDMDIEILNSKSEPFGRVTIEAMKSSNPVIGSKSGGTIELIDEGETGFLYPYDNYQKLAECMKRFINNPELIEKMGRKAYERTKERFTAQDNAEKVMAVYREVLAK